jgi:DNA-binding NarL/FixJ family response regulator
MQSETERIVRGEGGVSALALSAAVVGRTPLLRSLLAEALTARGLSAWACGSEEELTGLCASPEAAPDVVVFIVDRNPLGALGELRRLIEVAPSRPVVLVALEVSAGAVQAALRLGAKAVVGGGSGVDELLVGIQKVSQGRIYLDPDLIEAAVHGLQIRGRGSPTHEGGCPLSRREEEIVSLLCDGLAPKDVARHLHLSVKTVENHKYNIYRKCGVSSATELLRYAIQQSIVSL